MDEVKQGVRGAIDMTHGSPTRLILRFSLSLIFTQASIALSSVLANSEQNSISVRTADSLRST